MCITYKGHELVSTQVSAYGSSHNDSVRTIAHRGTIQKYHTVPEHGRVGYVLPIAKVMSSVKIDTTKIYTKRLFFYKIMPQSRNVNHDKMSACHQGHEGYTDCNVGQAN